MGQSSHPSYPHPGGGGHSKSGMGMFGPALGAAGALGAGGLLAVSSARHQI